MSILIVVALVFSLTFLALFLRTKKGEPGGIASFVAFAAWGLYVAYETIYIPMWLKTISGAPIRIDLLLFIPLLIVVSLVAFIRRAVWSSRRHDEREGQ